MAITRRNTQVIGCIPKILQNAIFSLLKYLGYILTVGLSHFLTPSLTQAEQPRPISYLEAIKLSLKSNPRIGASQAHIESARAAIIETRGSGLPKIGMAINTARSDNPLNVFSYKLSQGNVSFADFGLAQYTGPNSINIKPQALNAPGYYSNYNAGFQLTIPIYLGGKTFAKIRSTNALLNAAQQGDEAARMQLAYEILQAYEGVLAANQLVSVAKEEVNSAISYLKTTKALFQQSLVIESDLLLAHTYLRTAKTSLLAAQAESQNHLDEFRSLIGHQESSYIPKESVHFSPTKKTMTDLTHNALIQNAQLRAIKSTIEAGRANIDAVNSENKPQINLQLHHDWNGDTFGTGLPSNLIALGVQWELFSSGERAGAVQKAIADVKQAAFQLEDTANTLRLALIQAQRAERLAAIQYKANRSNALQAQEVVAHLTKRYGRGLISLGQLLESQMKLAEAKNLCIQSQYNQVIARGRMLMLTNELISSSENVIRS